MVEDEDEDTFVTIGTPFQPLEEEDNNRLIHAKERKPGETYRERRERERFHGAFTGGFSAGYYNTVGSKEGWTPSSFVSSRKTRDEKSKIHKPEDFMDSEDFGKFGIAPKRIAPTRDFQVDQEVDEIGKLLGKRSQSDAKSSVLSDLFGDNFLSTIVVPTRSSVGVDMLKTMGWKEGGGIGAKVNKQMDQIKGTRSYGCMLPPSMTHVQKAPYECAPGDVRPWTADPKKDVHGLGYSGISQDKLRVMKGKEESSGLHGIMGQAFGVGALEEEDEDIYATEKVTSYDFGGLSDHKEEKFGWTGPHSSEGRWSTSKDFVKQKGHLQKVKIYPAPELPKHFTPRHAPKHMSGNTPRQARDKLPKERHYSHNASSRGQLIGEEKSVFSLLKPKDRDKFKEADSLKDKKRSSRWDQTDVKGRQSSAKASGLQAAASSILADKFTKEGQTSSNSKSDSKSKVETLDEREKAASMNKFGSLTREITEWHPHRVLCKRFDVPDPYPRSGLVGPATSSGTESKKSKTLSWTTKQGAEELHDPTTEEILQSSLLTGGGLLQTKGKDNVKPEQVEPALEEEQKPTAPPVEPAARPSMDIFRAIFEDSASFSESSEESESETETKMETSTTGMEDIDKTSENVQFSKLGNERPSEPQILMDHSLPAETTQPPPTAGMTTGVPVNTVETTCHTQQPQVTSEQFGPILPPNVNAGDSSSDSDGDDKINICTTKKQHKHKRKKKEKHRKHKHKTKSKDKKQRNRLIHT